MGGFVVLGLFTWWQGRRERFGRDPLVNMSIFRIAPLRAGLGSFLAQNTILLGIFFALPLYLQIVLGFDALETGIRMLPISIATSAGGSALAQRFPPRRIVQGGFVILGLATFFMIQTIEPDLRGFAFGFSLAILGVGMGLVASQLGNVIQSSVGPKARGEAGGLQYTAQQLGSSIGTALIGAIVITALVTAFVNNIEADERVSADVTEAVEVNVASGASFVASSEVENSLRDAGVDEPTTAAVVENYEDAQLDALKAGLLLAAFIAIGALFLTRRLPGERLGSEREELADADAG
jgi:Major Facilitator Superfamily